MLKPVLNLLIFLFFIVANSTAQYSFVNYDHTNGMPLDEVKEIVEDKQGYIWFGGPLGLSRFDGRNFTHYYRGSSTHKVAGNIVNDIKVAPNGDVVAVYDDNGISIYNHKTDEFRSKKYSASDSLDFPRHSIFFVYVENDTSAYLGANREGLFHINLRTFESVKVPIDFIPYDMHFDPDNENSYLLTGRGLHRLDMNNFTLEKLTTTGFSKMSIIGREVWYNGYFKYISKFNLDSRYEHKYHIISSGVIRGWTIVDKNLWVGTPDGIEVIDTSKNKVVTTMKVGVNIHDLPGSFIYGIYKDSKSRVWVANDGGVSLYDPSKSYFARTPFLTTQSTDLNTLYAKDFISIDFYRNMVLYIDEKRGEEEIEFDSDLSGPVKFLPTKDKKLILFFNGIAEYNERSNSLSEFSCPFTASKKRGLIDVINEEEKWLGIYRYQNILVTWDSKTDNQDTIKFNSEPRGIVSANNGDVFVYGVNLLCRYNLESGKAVQLDLSKDEYLELGADLVKIDKIEDTYWISTRINGVFRAIFDGDRFKLLKHYNTQDGLTNNNVVTTCLDEYNNLFVQCRSDIFVLDKIKDRFFSLGGTNDVNFQVTRGLAAIDSIVYALGHQSKSIDLRKVDTSQKELNTVIEHVVVNGKKKVDFDLLGNILKYDENNIGISFNTFEYTEPSIIRHRYRLDEFSDWIYTEPNAGTIQLSALASGKYNFQLSASDGSGVWIEPLEWKFSISPPYWRSWWFVLLILGFLLLLGNVVFQYRMKQLGKLNNMKVKLAELEGESLRAQMNPHFVFNALNSIKSYIIKNSKEEAADYLTTFSELIRAVLRNSTQKEISLKDEIEALTLYLQIENLRLNQPFDYEIKITEDINPLDTSFPPLIIQPFVENSIWHGFVHKKTGGKLLIDIHKDGTKLSIDVIDDGVGRAKSKEIEKSRERKRSYGIAITETRLNNIADKADIQIIDLYDNNGVGSGTKVHIELPLKKIEAKNY